MTNTPTKTLAVSAICHGTVIDHIQAGQGIKIVKLLKLAVHKKQVTLGLNLPSQSIGYKDIIKVEERELTPEEANQVAILAPEATITIIKDYDIAHKFKVAMPEKIKAIIPCPNPQCISNHESVASTFEVLTKIKNHVQLKCHYCRKSFDEEDIH